MAGKKIIQIVGFQNSGKTTLIEQLIKACKEKGLRIGTIKHHGHGGKPDRAVNDKDTGRHMAAGATAAAVEGAGSLHIEVSQNQWKLEDILQIYDLLPLDIILVEGYKKLSCPKVVLLRNREDDFLLDELSNIVAVVSRRQMIGQRSIPFFRLEETEPFIKWFFNNIVCKQH
ncbi:molybdopterin-guanine dinucleotide biosynthesis protein B [Siminovitchia sediminis]|uniref:Molybdopterin-guanine dinucleotide biosynthesis protein B n=1 Tax=Siminovitchia sediminis TaxID=1274353 RepID=A0ABW4KDB3_9BACI